MEFGLIKKSYEEQKMKKQAIEQMLSSLEDSKAIAEEELEIAEKSRAVLQEVAKITQNNLKVVISNLVTTAMLSVDSEWPSLEVAFESRRNQSEIDFFFNNKGKLQDPLGSSGGGVVDIASIAARISIWSLNKNRPVFILDEPSKFLSKNYSKKASEMLKMLCDKLGLQIIMVSHDSEITDFADRVFRVTKRNRISKVKEI